MRRVVVTVESRYSRTPDGAVWTHEGPAHRFFGRYLSVFDEVRVVARVRDATEPDDGAVRVDGPGVTVAAVPYYRGPRQYLRRWPQIRDVVSAAAGDLDAVILRVPSFIGSLLAAGRRRRRLGYALEVMGDPYDVFAPGVVDHPLRPLLRLRYTARLRQMCGAADGVAYVTERYLQARYPAGPGAATACYSSVDLPPAAFLAAPRQPASAGATRTLVSIGSLDQLYKGIDTLLLALARLTGTGERLRLTHIGDGVFRPRLEQLTAQLGLAGQVTFTGTLPSGEAVRRHLDQADLFVMPSRTEGLPKALVEAMARGLPAVGTSVGGIPELLAPECLVAPGQPAELAGRIRWLLADPGRQVAAATRNLARARDFTADALAPRRTAFYRAIGAMVPDGQRSQPVTASGDPR